jgi:hypothetical protein
MMDLSPEESLEHSRLLNDYVQAVEAHKRLALAGPSNSDRDQRIRQLWEADGTLESAREALEQFRLSHGMEQ